MGKFWAGLSERQRFAIYTVGGWCGAWLVENILTALARDIPAWAWLTVIANFIARVLINWYVGSFLLGALAITFGPGFWAAFKRDFKKYGFGVVLGYFFLIGLCLVAFILGANLYNFIVQTPRAFTVPISALRDSGGTARVFTTKSISQLEDIYRDNTDLSAQTIFGREAGKWISVRGAISNVSAADPLDANSPVVATLSSDTGHPQIFIATFNANWRAQVNLPKWTVIYTVCKIRAAATDNVQGDSCELVSP